jgi:hypothetical protein
MRVKRTVFMLDSRVGMGTFAGARLAVGEVGVELKAGQSSYGPGSITAAMSFWRRVSGHYAQCELRLHFLQAFSIVVPMLGMMLPERPI